MVRIDGILATGASNAERKPGYKLIILNPSALDRDISATIYRNGSIGCSTANVSFYATNVTRRKQKSREKND